MTNPFAGPWYVSVFFVIGILATISALITLFWKLGRRPDAIWSTDAPPLDSDDFMRSLSGLINAPAECGGGAELLNNGVGFYPRMLEDLRAAERTINFSAYIWEEGAVSDRFLELLAEKARAGVQVRVLLDALGAWHAPDEKLAQLAAAGAKVERFRPPRFGKLSRFHRRNHRRAIVIDGHVGYTGGAAVADHWEGDARNPEEWRDVMIRMTGCTAGTLQSAFTELWAYTCGEILVGPDFYPEFDDTPSGDRIEKHMGVVSSPADEEHPLRLLFALTFLAARKQLWITTPYFVPDANTRRILAERAKAGVDVRLLLPNEHIDAAVIRWASHSYYHELLAAGVRIFEYQPTMMHAKLLTADAVWSIVGSANLDIRSKELNNENVIALQDASFAEVLEKTFQADCEAAREITLHEWRKRPLRQRAIERFCVLFAEQY